MAKIIIEHDGVLTDEEVMRRVTTVVSIGKISGNKQGKHYCWRVQFGDGCVVETRAKRRSKAADSFVVHSKVK